MSKKVVTEEKEEKTKRTKEQEIYIYIGETIATSEINIRKNDLIKDILTFKKTFDKYEGLEKLFVKMSEYPVLKERLKNKNYYIHKKISELVKQIREGGK